MNRSSFFIILVVPHSVQDGGGIFSPSLGPLTQVNAVLPGGMTICFQSVTECDADTCENLYAVVLSTVS